MKLSLRSLALALPLLAVTAPAQLNRTITDASTGTIATTPSDTLGTDEYGVGNGQSVTGSGRSGFSGAVGLSNLYLDTDTTNIQFGFDAGGDLNDNYVLYRDTRDGGFTDAQMSDPDTTDGGRQAVTNPVRDSSLVFDASFVPDFAVVFGNFGTVAFELTGGSLNFISPFDGTPNNTDPTLFRESVFSRASLGIGTDATFDFVGIYTSGTGFLSNESLAGDLGGDNPGFGAAGTPVSLTQYDRFTTAAPVPEPATMAILGLGAAALLRRRRKA